MIKLRGEYQVERNGETLHVTKSGEDFTIGSYVKTPSKFKRRLHYHDFYELEFVVDGCGANIINGLRFELRRGSMFLCRPTDMHKYEIGEGERLEVYSVRFSGAMLSGEIDQALNESSALCGNFNAEYRELKRIFDNAVNEYRHPDRYSNYIYKTAVTQLVVRLLRVRRDNSDGKFVSRLAAEAQRYINTRFASHITLRDVAASLRISIESSRKIFSESMNISFCQYLKRVRLLYAMNRIVNTDDTIQCIALECGFSSASVFAREFKSYYGNPPTFYRDGSHNDMDKRKSIQIDNQN